MSEELEKLLEKRREIDAQIRKLRNTEIVFGRAKFKTDHYTTSLPDEYVVMASYETRLSKLKWSTVIRTTKREDVVPKIQELIDSLTELKKKLEEECTSK